MSRSGDNPYQAPQASTEDAPPRLNAVLPACIAAGTAFVAGLMVFVGIAIVSVIYFLDGTLLWRTTQFAVVGTCLALSIITAALVGRYVYRQRVHTHERLMRLHQERERLANELDRRKVPSDIE